MPSSAYLWSGKHTKACRSIMQLQKIQQFIADYRNWLPSRPAEGRLYYWETQARWQAHWDLNAPDLRPGYTAGLENSHTRRPWKREGYEPKRMMLAFMDMEPEFVRTMFRDLFNENKEVSGRADRFVFYCDQLLLQYRERFPLRIDTSHYHDDGYEIVSLYLCLQFPLLYTPYQASRLITLLERLGARDLPRAGDFERHCKLMRTLQTMLLKDDLLMARHRARLQAYPDYQPDSLLLAFDFSCFVTGI